MPRVAELREIDGYVWAKLESFTGNTGEVTLWSRKEIQEYKEACVRDFLMGLFDQWKDQL